MKNNNNYKRSRITRHSWLGLAIFFIIFCSCPVKRFFKLQLYKHADPIESTSNNLAFSKELKDCNLIEKRILQSATFPDFRSPEPKQPNSLMADMALPLLFLTGFVPFYERKKREPSLLWAYTCPKDGDLPLYLRCHRIQV